MPKPDAPQPLQASAATVKAVDSTNRFIDIQYMGSDRTKKEVILVMDPGNYAFPKVGDRVFVLDVGERTYCLGRIDYRYKTLVDGGTKDETTGVEIKTKDVHDNEIYLGNFLKRTWLSLSNSGDFSLMAAKGGGEGLKYIFKDRFLKLAGMAVQVIGNGARVAFGSVVRNIAGEITPIPSDAPLLPAVEGVIDLYYSTLRLARMGIGHIKNSLGIDEFGSWGARLRAIIEVCQAGVPIAVMKMDEAGNIEISSTLAQVMLDSTIPVNSVLLGGLAAAFSVPLGESLNTWLTGHTHSSGTGPTGVPIIPPTSALLSQKVKVSA
jgi:hypothetical protein